MNKEINRLKKQIEELKKDKNVWMGLCKMKGNIHRLKVPLRFNEIDMIQKILLGECMPTFSYREGLVKKLEKLRELKIEFKKNKLSKEVLG